MAKREACEHDLSIKGYALGDEFFYAPDMYTVTLYVDHDLNDLSLEIKELRRLAVKHQIVITTKIEDR